MALPTPVLTKRVLDMYDKPEPGPPPPPPPVQISVAQGNHAQSVTMTTLQNATSSKPSFQQPSYQPIVVVTVDPHNTPDLQPLAKIPRMPNGIPMSSHLPMRPVDPHEQEQLKVDRKRERNRVFNFVCDLVVYFFF